MHILPKFKRVSEAPCARIYFLLQCFLNFEIINQIYTCLHIYASNFYI